VSYARNLIFNGGKWISPWHILAAAAQVHSSDMPQTWNMTKCLVVAACTAAVGIAGSVLLLYLSLPSRVNWFAALGTPVDHGLPVAPHSTNGQVFLSSDLLLTCISYQSA
jgi:hypothetical protein